MKFTQFNGISNVNCKSVNYSHDNDERSKDYSIAPINVDDAGVGIWSLLSKWIDIDEHTISWNVVIFNEHQGGSILFRSQSQSVRTHANAIGVDVATSEDGSRLLVCTLETNMSHNCCVHCYEYDISIVTTTITAVATRFIV